MDSAASSEYLAQQIESLKKELRSDRKKFRNLSIHNNLTGLYNVHLGASFGIATYPDDTDNREGLLTLADKAMFHIKQTGKGLVGTTPNVILDTGNTGIRPG
jgi:GGDEF domain-containing protein